MLWLAVDDAAGKSALIGLMTVDQLPKFSYASVDASAPSIPCAELAVLS